MEQNGRKLLIKKREEQSQRGFMGTEDTGRR